MLMMSRFVSRSFEGVCSFGSRCTIMSTSMLGWKSLGVLGDWLVDGELVGFELKMMYGKQ